MDSEYRYCWGNKYDLERGDVVEVVNPNHPLFGEKGIVDSALGQSQFGVVFSHGQELTVWSKDVKVLSTMRKTGIPQSIIDAFNESNS